MALKVGELYATADIRNQQFNAKLGNMQRMLGRGGALVGAAVAGTAAIGAAFSAVAADGINQFKQLETGMSEVFTLLPDATDDMKRQMIDDLQEFKMEMGTTTEETVPALYDAISAGVPRENVFQFLETAQKAAKGGVTDLNTAVDGLTTVVNAYGKEIEDAEDVSDVLFTTVRTGKTTMDELGSSLSDVAPIAAAVGVDFQDIGAALATMTAQGVPTAEATTQLRQALNELSKEGTNAYDTFKNIAGEAFTDFIANGGNLQEAMVLMEQAAKNNNTAVQNMFSNIRGGQAALTLTGSGAETFANNLDAMADRAGATDDAFNTMMDTSQSWQNRLTAAFEVVREKIGEELQPYFQAFVEYAVQNMPKVIEAVDKLGPAIEETLDFLEPVIDGFKLFYDTVVLVVESAVDVFYQLYLITEIADGVTEAVAQIFLAGISYWEEIVARGIKKMIYKVSQTVPGGDKLFGGFLDSVTGWHSEATERFVRFDSKANETVQNIKTDMNALDAVFKDSGSNTRKNINTIISDFRDLAGASDNNTESIVKNDEEKAKSFKEYVNEAKKRSKELEGVITGGESETGGGSNVVKKTEKEKQVVKDKWDAYTKWMKEYRKQQWMEAVNEREKEDQLEQEKWDQYTQWAIEYNQKRRMQEFNQKEKEKQLEKNKWDAYTEWAKGYSEREAERREEELQASIERVAKEKQLEREKWASYTAWAKQQQAEQEKINEQEMEMYEEKFGFIKEGFSQAFTSILNGTKSVTDAFGDLWKGILDNVIKKLAEMAATKVFNFLISGGASGGGGFLSGIGTMLGFAQGGVVPGPKGAGRLALVHGQEEVLTPAQRKQRGSGGKGTANIIVNLDGRTIAKAIEQPLLDTITIKGGVTAR